MKRALITGITGQDGSYLADFLLERGYKVHGIVRRVALEDPIHRLWRIRHIKDKLHLHAASLESYASIFRVVDESHPDECYHFAAQSFVSYSFDDEFSTLNTNINGTHYILSALKERAPHRHFYFAGSIEAPIRTYSTGMVARLGFAVATCQVPDILIVDEILSVGDVPFQEKCLQRLHQFRDAGTTILLVSHGMETIRRMCGRAAWLEKGHVRELGAAEDVSELYLRHYTGTISS